MPYKSKVLLKGIEYMYNATCTITSVRTNVNEFGQDTSETVVLYEGQPCHVSAGSSTSADDMEAYRKSEPVKKIFVSSDLNIPVGSSFVVISDSGEKTMYKDSGKPNKYLYHQEIMVVQI